MDSDVTIVHGQLWWLKTKRETKATFMVNTYSVAIISIDHVGLSGPGPCRGIKYVSLDELEADWERVPMVPCDAGGCKNPRLAVHIFCDSCQHEYNEDPEAFK